MPNLVLEIGENRLVVDTDKITLRRVKELAVALSDIQIKYSAFSKITPLKDKETREEYVSRAEKERLETMKRKKAESSEDYVKRLYAVNLDPQGQLYDVLLAIAKLSPIDGKTQEDKVSEQSFEEVSYAAAKKFVLDILTSCDLA